MWEGSVEKIGNEWHFKKSECDKGKEGYFCGQREIKAFSSLSNKYLLRTYFVLDPFLSTGVNKIHSSNGPNDKPKNT